MYGLILDSMADCIKKMYGDKIWHRIVGSNDISNTFTTHKVYDEQLIPMIANSTEELTGVPVNLIMEEAGKHFIVYIDNIRNDRIIKVLGRTFRDFLNGLDCMHEFYRFSFADIQPPSFHISKEDVNGLELHYRSRRTFTGFMYYVKGLIRAIADKFYSVDVAIHITQHGFTGDVMLAVYRLDYPNDLHIVFQNLVTEKRQFRLNKKLIFPSKLFFEQFPFHVVFDERLQILTTGHGLNIICNGLNGKRLNETFFMTRPLGYDLTWDNVLIHRNNVFELTSVKSTARINKNTSQRFDRSLTHFIKLRGQMLYVEEWDFVIFLATFVMDDLDKMYEMGVYVNDLTFHDLSRDMVLHGLQQTTEYKLALDLEQGKNSRLEEIIRTLENEQQVTDNLLYSMIPKEIASSLRKGNTSVSLCEKYEDVTVLFSDVVNFAHICDHIEPHEIMKTLNKMVKVFDILCKTFNTYKVETVADGFMCISGAPTYDENHTKVMADMAIEMLIGIKTVLVPKSREPIKIRIGLHCGGVVAGLVGHKIPRYCLFGDTVNIASKLEAAGKAERIQISQCCKDKLVTYGTYVIQEKDDVGIKGSRSIKTYWLNGRLSNLNLNISYDLEDINDISPYNADEVDNSEEKVSKQGKIDTGPVTGRPNDQKLHPTRLQSKKNDKTSIISSVATETKEDEINKILETIETHTDKQEMEEEKDDGGQGIEEQESKESDGVLEEIPNSTEDHKSSKTVETVDRNVSTAYSNLMRVIGLEAPLKVIVDKNCTILTEGKKAEKLDQGINNLLNIPKAEQKRQKEVADDTMSTCVSNMPTWSGEMNDSAVTVLAETGVDDEEATKNVSSICSIL
uniref:soluble guanylate cyclase 88E-like n=1 Tax=Ciona intestinalis TaxID=7719 RepID=UPI0005217C65|nr:soluble guanylate cyclase 88E-like [Ciona intestinalis]|eukprot:XP_026694132.1 soluble guanylate cyclase 88E-like [Ciona intestinalis]